MVAALAAAVPRVRIGTLVYGNTYRHPAVLANMAATVDQVSGGRFVLGLGAGWQVNEHEQYGIDLPPVGERVDRFAEAVEVVRSLLAEPTTTFEGRHYRLTDALCEPKPVQDRLPILVGAKGDRMIGIAARFADEWNTWGLPDHIAERLGALTPRARRRAATPTRSRRSAQGRCSSPRPTPRPSGSPTRCPVRCWPAPSGGCATSSRPTPRPVSTS